MSSSELPSPNEGNETYEMLKDEKLTVLSTKGHEHLQQIVSCDLSKATKYVLREISVHGT